MSEELQRIKIAAFTFTKYYTYSKRVCFFLIENCIIMYLIMLCIIFGYNNNMIRRYDETVLLYNMIATVITTVLC
jgi:hypothetical protein